MKYYARQLVDAMFKVFQKIAIGFLAVGALLVGVGGVVHVVQASPTVTVENKALVKHFKLRGLNCTSCYLSIVRQVNKLPGVKKAHFIKRTKTLIIIGSGYSMKEVHRIVRSEKQRIVG